MRIVYVEDNLTNVHLVKRVARMGNHEIINYIDGQDALKNFKDDNPDLVLMDIQLAGELTGIDVVKKIRAQGYTTPIYAVTAYAMVGDKERCLEAGCDGYISKPIPVTELVKIIDIYNQPESAPETTKPVENDIPETTAEAKTEETLDHQSIDKPVDTKTEGSTHPSTAPKVDTKTIEQPSTTISKSVHKTPKSGHSETTDKLVSEDKPTKPTKVDADASTTSNLNPSATTQ